MVLGVGDKCVTREVLSLCHLDGFAGSLQSRQPAMETAPGGLQAIVQLLQPARERGSDE
jgi:hypothetical protein